MTYRQNRDTDLLEALGWRTSLLGGICLLALVAIVTVLFLVAGMMLASELSISAVYIQIAIWGLWLTWLGVVFPRNSRNDAARPCALPYRRAFIREILFGVAVAFSQILRPAVSGISANGFAIDGAPNVEIGVPLAIVGLTIIGLGVSVLGIARTLFVYEYVSDGGDVIMAGIYRVLRHPLFLGGSMVSLGLAICTGDRVAIALGIVNVCVVPIYARLEDRRCCMTLGRDYMDYRVVVGGMVPRLRSSIRRSARTHQVAGRIGPMTVRNLVRRR
jgi:protein-S-isoprenylcysteine O-methyltransferase Ste14